MRKVLTGTLVLVVGFIVAGGVAALAWWAVVVFEPFPSQEEFVVALGAASGAWLLAMLPFSCIVWGYCSRTYANLMAGQELPLPRWNAWGLDLTLGFQHLLVAAVWAAPLFIVTAGTYGTLFYLVEHYPGPKVEDTLELIARVATAFFAAGWLAYFVLIAAPWMVFAETRSLVDAFRIPTLVEIVRGSVAPYAAALFVASVALAFASLGFVMMGFGIFATQFFARLVAVHLFAQVRTR